MLSLGNMENAPPPQAPGLISNQVPPSAPGRFANAAPPSSSSQFTNPTSAPPPMTGYGVTTTPGAPSFYPPPPANQNQTGKGRFTSEIFEWCTLINSHIDYHVFSFPFMQCSLKYIFYSQWITSIIKNMVLYFIEQSQPSSTWSADGTHAIAKKSQVSFCFVKLPVNHCVQHDSSVTLLCLSFFFV